MSGEVWQLHADGRVVADLRVVERDFPWLHARVEARDGFVDVAVLFAEELRLLHAEGDASAVRPATVPAPWDAAYDRIRERTRLTYPDGDDVPEYLLHIDGDRAWWRWSDSRFE
jgi:hypothetical protein